MSESRRLTTWVLLLFKRSSYAIAVLVVVLILNFLMINLAPGDVADTIAQSMGGTDAEMLAEIRSDYGLDQPLLIQLAVYLGKVARFDLGYSYFYNQPVTDLIFEKLPATLLLVITAQFLAVVIGVILGMISIQKRNGFADHFVTFFALFTYSAPVFWTGILLLIAFSLYIPLFPVAGMMDVTRESGFWNGVVDIVHHAFLPVLSLMSIFLAIYSRTCRASLLEVMGADYIRTARSKGLNEQTVLQKHALKNALPPVITLAGMQFSAVVSGAVLVETVYNWPGLGTLAYGSIVARDTPTILGILFFSACIVVIGNLITDMVLKLIDPRIDDKS